MRRRKSSCPNIEPRRTSSTPNRNTVKLDLYIEDDELHPVPGGVAPRRNSPSPTTTSNQNDHHHSSATSSSSSSSRRRSSTANIEDTAEEVLCLRLLSTRTRYRFGGLRVNLISPVFNVDKLFNVEFDQDSQISLIKSQQSSFDHTIDSPTKSFFNTSNIPAAQQQPTSALSKAEQGRCATIVIEPESEDQKDEITRQLPLLTADLTLLEESTSNSEHKSSMMTKSHVTARSLTRIPEPEMEQQHCTSPSIMQHWRQRHQSGSSSITTNNNFNNNFNLNNINNNNNNDYQLSSSVGAAAAGTGNTVKFDNVKLYRQAIESTEDNNNTTSVNDPPGQSTSTTMLDTTFNLDTIAAAAAAVSASTKELSASVSASASPAKSSKKEQKKSSTKSKIKEMRRHTHFYCHIPTSLLQNYAGLGGGSTSSSSSKRNNNNNNNDSTGPAT